MSAIDYQKRATALAGLLQAVHLVSSIARTGMASQDAIDNSLRSIFVTNPDSIAEVFGGTDGIRVGLKLAGELFSQLDLRVHGELIGYGLAVIALERRLAQRPKLLRELGARIASVDELRHLAEDGTPILDDVIVEALAQVYEQILSPLEPRINVSGKQNFLQHVNNQTRIRALLLAAVRAAVLYYQVGGRRWQLAFARGHMSNALEYLH